MGDPRRATADPGGPPSRPARCPTTPARQPTTPPTQEAYVRLDRQVPTQAVQSRSWTVRATRIPAIAAVRLPAHRHPSMTSRSDSGHGSARTPDASPWTPDGGHPDAQTPLRTLDSSSRGQARVDTGRSLRTPDAGRGCGHGDEGTAGIRTCWAAAPNGGALDAHPCPSGQRPQRVATMTAQRWAGPPASTRPSLAGPGNCSPHRRPCRASAHCCPHVRDCGA